MGVCDGCNDFATVFAKDFCPIRDHVNNIIASGFVSTFNGVTGGITVAGTSGISVAAQGGGSFLIGYPSGVGVRSLQTLQGDLTLTGISGIVIDVINDSVIRIAQASGAGGGGGGNPVDSRAVTGHINPDTNIVYDIGISGTRYRTIFANSGVFSTIAGGSPLTIQAQHILLNPDVVVPTLVSGVNETEPGYMPTVDTSGYLGIATQRWHEVRAVSGAFSDALVVGGRNVVSEVTAIQASGGPIDQRLAIGHANPDTDSAYDIGTTSLRWRTLNAVSGNFSLGGLAVAGSGVPVQITGTSGIVINNDGMGNVSISQTQGRVAQLSATDTDDINASATNNLMSWGTQNILHDDVFTHSTSTNNSRLTADLDGLYLAQVTIAYEVAEPDEFSIHYNGIIKFRVNGSTVQFPRGKSGYVRNASFQNESSLTLSMILDLNAGDYVEVLVDRESDMTGIVNKIGAQCVFYMVRL